MDTILFWGIIAIICASLQSIGVWRYGLFCGFLITTTLLAIHYDFGTDYWAYFDWYEESLSTPIPNSIAEFLEINRDPGWDLLNILFGRIFGEDGFFIMVAVLSIIEGLCYYTFIKKCVPSQWYWLAMTMYILNNHLFILTFSMMRQSLVMAILLICFIWIEQKKVILPTLTILLASTIHNSILICLPIIFLSYIPMNNQKPLAIILTILWIVLLLASTLLESILTQIASLTEIFERYVETYTEDSEMTFGLGYLLRLLPFFCLIWGLFTNKFTKEDIPILLIWSLTIILTPFGRIIPLFARLLFYFELAGLVAIPKLITVFNSKLVTLLLIFSTLLLFAYALNDSFYSPTSVYYDTYLNYHTIFEII